VARLASQVQCRAAIGIEPMHAPTPRTAASLLLLAVGCRGGEAAEGSGHASEWGADSGSTAATGEASGAVDGSTGGPGFDPMIEPACEPNPGTPDASKIYTIAAGAWSDPTIWSSGAVPGAGADVVVQRCHRVSYDRVDADALHTLLVNGQLTFATDVDTTLAVGLLVVTPDPTFDMGQACAAHTGEGHDHGTAGDDPHLAALEVGTPTQPVAAGVRATIELTSFADLDADCAPALVAQGGRLDLHGAPLGRASSELDVTAVAGASTVTLRDAVQWRPGDRVLLSATDFNDTGRDANATYRGGELEIDSEERTITAIDPAGTTLSLDAPLTHEHAVLQVPQGDLRGEVGNLTRNVVVTSADAEGPFGHVMIHHGSAGSISWAEFRDLGKPGTLGRYALHYHRPQDSMRGTSVVGASIWNAHNRWIAQHAIEYLVVRDLVAYQSVGHGIFLEDASEQYNLLDRSLLVQAYASVPVPGQALDYDQNLGACYWSANARNFVTDTVFVECGDSHESFTLDYRPDDQPMPTVMLQPDGTRAEVDARTVSAGRYEGLEFHNHRGWAFWIRGGAFPADEPLQVVDLTVWQNHYAIDLSGDNVMVDGVAVYFTPYGFYNNFPGSHRVRDAYMYRACGHGAFMTYLGGHGVQIYEGLRLEECAPNAFRIDATSEVGAAGVPIEIHARDYQMLAADPNLALNWAGTVDANSRPDPMLMLVLHDAFGTDDDAVVLPATQSPSLPGVPEGLAFSPGDTVAGPQGLYFAGRGATLVAHGDVAFPEEHPLMHPVDRVPPATVITWPTAGERVRLGPDGTLTVRGVSLDASKVSEVIVNGQVATLDPNGMDWSVTFDDVPEGGIVIEANATDTEGLVEALPHALTVWISRD
jgi:hypothetical protein